MGKVMLQELAAALVERRSVGKKESTRFVSEMFYVIQQTLDQERLVKVKGLGTFKIIDVDDRESVDVNTGERVLIEGHNKITFTPDALMKELVNKPFSQFETVVLNEGVDFKDTPEAAGEEEEESAPELRPLVDFVVEDSHEEEPQPVVEVVEEEAAPAEEPVLVVEETAPVTEPTPVVEAAPVVDEPAPVEETAPVEEQEEEPEEEAEEEAEEDTPAGKRNYLWPVITLAACCLGFLFGYLTGHYTAQPQEAQQPAAAVAVAEKKAEPVVKKDTAAVKEDTVTVKKDTVRVKEVAEKATAVSEAEPATATSAPAAAADDFEKYNQMDNRVRTGAYRIVGTDQVMKVRPGDDLARICKRTLGPGMECYIEVFNGIKGSSELTAGQDIKIPKLELKKKKPQKAE